MAYIGMRSPIFAPITTPRVDGSAIEYGTPIVLGPAVSANVTFDIADNPDYGDDVVIDNDNGVNGFSMTAELNDISKEGRAACLGWKPVTGTGSTVVEYDITDATPPEGGFAYIRVKMFRGVRYYEAFFVHAIKFSSGGENASTKQRQITWNHPTINGQGLGVYIDDSGEAKYIKWMEFSDFDDAMDWIYEKFGATRPT